MEWCDYSEIWDPIDMEPDKPQAERKYEVRTLLSELNTQSARLLMLDLEGAGRADLLVWSSGASPFSRLAKPLPTWIG